MSALPSNNPGPATTRLDFRLSPEHKALIEQAADLGGQTVSNFAISTLIKAAAEAIERSTVRALSAHDAKTFVEMLDADAEPNAALKAAANRYKARHGR